MIGIPGRKYRENGEEMFAVISGNFSKLLTDTKL